MQRDNSKKVYIKQINFYLQFLSNVKKILTITRSKAIPSRFMANTKSAIKRIRRIKKQTSVNKARKSRFKIALKKMNGLIENKDKKKPSHTCPS